MDIQKTIQRILVSLFILHVLVACGEDDFDPFPIPMPPISSPTGIPTPKPSETPLPMPPIENPKCGGTMQASDGPGGFLWKKSDTTGSLVVLLPGRFEVPFDTVTALRKNGRVEQLRFTGFANPDAEGERQHWRSNTKADRFKDESLVIASEFENTCAWRIEKAARRND